MECGSTINFTSRTKARITENSSKNLVNTSSNLLLPTTLLKKGPADGNLAISDDICQQVPFKQTYHRYSEKSLERMEKNQNITSNHPKNLEKLWVIVSCQSPIVLGVKHQGARSFKNRAGKLHKTIPLWSPKNEFSCNDKR